MTTLVTDAPAAAPTSGDQLPRPHWLPAERWPFRLRHFAYRRPVGDTLDIHYTDEGSGPVLVFVHAGMWSFIWRDTIAALRDDFRCITLDFPGAGLSGGNRHDVDLTTYPDIVTSLLDHLGVTRATFVIHDLGGVVGVVAGTQRPERCAGLVVTNSFAWLPRGVALRTMLGVIGSRIATASLGTIRLVPRLTRTKAGVGRNYDKTDRRAFYGPFRRTAVARNFHRTIRSARHSSELYAGAESRLLEGFADLPVMTVFGERNDQFGFADRWCAMFPHARSWTVPGGNHFPMCDDPDGYAARIRDWHAAEVA